MSKKIKFTIAWAITFVMLLAITGIMYENRSSITKITVEKLMSLDIDYPDDKKEYVIGCAREASGQGSGAELIARRRCRCT